MVWTTSDEALEAGDSVRLEMQPGTLIKATGWIYGIPLISVLAGVLAGYFVLFAGRTEQPRVLLSAALGIGLMLISGTILAKLNEWVSQRIAINAHAAAIPQN
jgi:positive regulator of sigma E activity